MNSEFPVYGFKLEFFDEQAELLRHYYLTYRTERGEIEIFDLKLRRPFLKRTTLHNVTLKDLYVGNKLMINGRQYTITDYADEYTRNAFSQTGQHTYAMLKPGFYHRLGEALDRIYQEGLIVANLRFGWVSRDTAALFYQEHEGKPFYETLVRYITSGPIVALELVGPNAIAKWRQIIGPTYLERAKSEAPNSLRALYARSTTENFAHGSDSPTSAARELGIIFGNRSVQLSWQLRNTTCCVIKPHALKAGYAGKIIAQIVQSGFEITGAMLASLDINMSTEFLEVYRGVTEDFVEISQELASGPLIALELKLASSTDSPVLALREVCGPRDPIIAQALRPNSIRAKYGINIVKNAVHCTDIEDDALLECEYFFTLIDQSM